VLTIELVAVLRQHGIRVTGVQGRGVAVPATRIPAHMRKQVAHRGASLARWVRDPHYRWDEAEKLLARLELRLDVVNRHDVVLVRADLDSVALRLALEVLGLNHLPMLYTNTEMLLPGCATRLRAFSHKRGPRAANRSKRRHSRPPQDGNQHPGAS
jgi:hypothetical protein